MPMLFKLRPNPSFDRIWFSKAEQLLQRMPSPPLEENVEFLITPPAVMPWEPFDSLIVLSTFDRFAVIPTPWLPLETLFRIEPLDCKMPKSPLRRAVTLSMDPPLTELLKIPPSRFCSTMRFSIRQKLPPVLLRIRKAPIPWILPLRIVARELLSKRIPEPLPGSPAQLVTGVPSQVTGPRISKPFRSITASAVPLADPTQMAEVSAGFGALLTSRLPVRT